MKRSHNVEEVISIAVFLVMLSITFMNVISRYLLHMSLSFTEELVAVLFVLLSTIGGALAAKDNSHYTLDLITGSLSPEKRRKMLAFDSLLSILACGILVVTGVMMVLQQFAIGGLSYSLKVPEWIYGSFVPVGCFFMMIRFAQSVIRRWKESKGDKQ